MIGAQASRVNITLKGAAQSEPLVFVKEQVKFRLETSTASFIISNALIVNSLALPVQVVTQQLSKICAKEAGIDLQPFRVVPDILIGQDNCKLIVNREFRELESCDFVLSRCALGWTVHGSCKENLDLNPNLINSITCGNSECNFEKLDELLKHYFSLEALGVSAIPRVKADDKRALTILNESSRRVNGVWEVGLPWKDDDLDIPDSRPVALKRLRLLEAKLDRDPDYAELYYKEMDRLLDFGFAEKAVEAPKNRVWYLPHFGVVNANKPGRVRLVFDAAAKSNNTSFNDLLLPGPVLLKNLLGILMRFRQRAVAVKGDIKDMFLKIKVRPEDRDAQKFLWRGRNRDTKPQEFVMSSVLFGAKPSPCCALFIKNKNAERFRSLYPKAVKSIENESYMDDYLESFDSSDEAIECVLQIIKINKEADWDMHSWASNDTRLLTKVNSEMYTPNSVKLSGLDESKERVLGLQWLTDSDLLSFSFHLDKLSLELRSGEKRPSKREFLSIAMSVFDPLGFLAPFSIQARILMQDVWSSKIGWDEHLHDSHFERWKEWLCQLIGVVKCRIPRCYQLKYNRPTSIELHIFCDASEKAYAAVAYWRFVLVSGQVHTAFVLAKSRVAPVKPITIPRLELQAAVIGVRLAKTVISEHNFVINRRVFWSDSQTVLHWISSDPRVFKTFVMNRLGEISDESNAAEWRWVPSLENPADDATRQSPEALKEGSRWFLGPSFLRLEERSWPNHNKVADNNFANRETLEQKRVVLSIAKSPEISPYLPEFSRFSSWTRLLKVTVTVLRAVRKFCGKIDRILVTETRETAENLWFQEIQISSFNSEINALKKGKLLRAGRLAPLSPFLDSAKLLRVGGRVKRSFLDSGNMQPVILDGKHSVTQLIIKHFHEKLFHKGHETVVNELRQQFWIIGIRKALRAVIHRCILCKLLRAHPPNPKMADLPSARLGLRLRPFTHCGLDYFGPITVKIGRRREKRWGALFTCMSTRAIHIELAHSLSTDSAIMAIQRFAARRGFPSVLYSDNGTNFKGASQELSKTIASLNKNRQNSFAFTNNFKWKFNPPSAPHMGGAWERLIRSVKEALHAVLKEQAPKEETLLTLLAEIEHSINSRPLTHISPDPDDQEALTPNHFLIGSSSGAINFSQYDARNLCTRKQWRVSQYFADAFWKRWIREYLPTLVSRKKWFNSDEPLKVGDVVLIIDDQLPRNTWRKGKIIQIFPGSDEEVRVVELKTANGTLTRPSRKLIKFA